MMDFEVSRVLGRGGFSIVLEVMMKDSRESLACKILLDNNRQAIESFRREYALLNRLQHPCIPEVHSFGYLTQNLTLDAGESLMAPQGCPYFTMDVVRGESLLHYAEALDSPEQLIPLLLQLIYTLTFLHDRGLIHGDIKPQNILVERGAIKLLDYGTVHVPSCARSNPSIVTPAYAAPEILSGMPSSKRADFYSLGMSMLQCCEPRIPMPTDKGQREDWKRDILDGLVSRSGSSCFPNILGRLTQEDPRQRPDNGWAIANELFSSGQLLPAQLTAPRTVCNPELIGRHDELAWMDELYAEPTVGVVTIVSAPGMGKSRLVKEWLIRKQCEGVSGRWFTHGQDTAGFPAAPLSLAILLSELHLAENLDAGMSEDYLHELLTRIDAGLSGLETAGSPNTARGIVVLDDWQPAAGRFGDLEQRMLKMNGRLPFFLIRITGAPLEEMSEFGPVLELQGLGLEETKLLIRNLLIAPFLREDFAQFVYQSTQGNPAYIIDLINYLSQEGHLAQNSGWVEVDLDACREIAFMKINDLAVERIRSLAPLSGTILQILACCGTALSMDELALFWTKAAEQVGRQLLGPPPDRIELLKAEIELEVNGITRLDSEIAGARRYWFSSQDLERAAGATIPGLRRKFWHVVAAAFLSDIMTSPDGYMAALIGRHYELTGEKLMAMEWFLKAGIRLLKANDFLRADDMLKKVMPQKAELNAGQRAQLLYQSASIAILQNRCREATDLLLELKADPEAMTQLGSEAQLFSALGRCYKDQGKYQEALDMYREALKVVERDQPEDASARAVILAKMGWAELSQGNETAAEQHFNQSRRLVDKQDKLLPESRLLLAYATLNHRRGQYQAAVNYGERALNLAEKSTAAGDAGVAHHQIAMSLRELKETQRALEHARAAQQIFERLGDSPYLVNCLVNEAMIHTERNDDDAALEVLMRADAIAHAQENIPALVTLKIMAAENLHRSRRFEEEAQVLIVAEELARKVQDRNHTKLAALRSRCEWLLGRKEEARRWLKTAIELWPTIRDRYSTATAARTIAEAAERLGESETTLHWYLTAADSYQKNGTMDLAITSMIKAVNLSYALMKPETEVNVDRLNDLLSNLEGAVRLPLLLKATRELNASAPRFVIVEWLVQARRLALEIGDSVARQNCEDRLNNLADSSGWIDKAMVFASDVLKAVHDPETAYQILIKLAIQIGEAERGALVDVENDRPNTLIVGYEGRAMNRKLLDQISKTIMQKVISERRHLVSGNIKLEPDLAKTESLRRDCVVSVLCLPVMDYATKSLPAVLYLDHREKENAFDAGKIRALQEVSSKMAALIQQYKKVRERDRYLQTVLADEQWPLIYAPNNTRMIKLVNDALLWAKADPTLPILITGPPGAGKEVLARNIHRQSPRNGELFLPVICAALPDTLFESEIFGHVRGSFSGADSDREGKAMLANKGTLFLDEFGELSHPMQAKLLRFLELQEVQPVGSDRIKFSKARVIMATNLDLQDPEQKKKIRPDILSRCKIRMQMPALSEHREDIPHLISYFVKKKLVRPCEIAESAIDVLKQQDWEGNVRELLTVVQLAAIRCNYSEILPQHLDLSDSSARSSPTGAVEVHPGTSAPTVKTAESKQALIELLQQFNGDVKQVARARGKDLSSIYRQLQKLKIKPSKYRNKQNP